MIEYRYEMQLKIDGRDLDEQEISAYIASAYQGDQLMCAGDEKRVSIYYHTNKPWEILAYCAVLGEIYDIEIRDLIRQSKGLKG